MTTSTLDKLPKRLAKTIKQRDPNSPELWREYATILRRAATPEKGDPAALAEACERLGLTRAEVELHLLALAEERRLSDEAAGAEAAWSDLEGVAAEMLAVTARHRAAIIQHARQIEAFEARHAESWARYQTALDSRRQLNGTRRRFALLFGLPADQKLPDNDILPAAVRNAMLKKTQADARATKRK